MESRKYDLSVDELLDWNHLESLALIGAEHWVVVLTRQVDLDDVVVVDMLVELRVN